MFWDLLANSHAPENFPIWGTCLGFEQLAVLSSSATSTNSPLTNCDAENLAGWINMTDDWTDSVMAADMPDHVKEALTDRNVTFGGVVANYHSKCLTSSMFQKMKVNESWTF
jgi:hypothetical protein